ncbi:MULTISPECIES: hypothetical protein [Prevotellaceae]|uniref:hypothetical protein n=1 Tax=Prevotellaceae TaxID=171552 RepID=UPI0003D2A4B8|nr:hypothetical protein [Prevotella phocaeensis]ETD16566.1 hypothetical protein HMPREF1199_02236 [Hoylesella oralis CC98A]
MIRFKTKNEATKALTRAKMFFHREITKQGNYIPAEVSLYLDLIDNAILYIDPKANINELCREVGEKK